MNLNEMVAIEVMGWTKQTIHCPVDHDDVFDSWFENGMLVRAMSWNPTTNGNDMLWVIERMQGLGYGMIIDMFDGWYAARFYKGGIGAPSGDSGHEDTLPEAVCRAALEAVKHDR